MKTKKFIFKIISVLFVVFIIEGLSFLSLLVLERYYRIEYRPIDKHQLSARHRTEVLRLLAGTEYFMFDPVLGWTVQPNGKIVERGYAINSQGIRANQEYTPEPSKNVLRIAAFGDSFTHADQVMNDDMWTEKLCEHLSKPCESLNFGVSGYGPDQALLRYLHEGYKFKPNIVILGIMSENIHRVVNVFRPFYDSRTGLPLTKPRFEMRKDQLTLLKNPIQSLDTYKELLNNAPGVLPQLGQYDRHYQVRYGKSRFDILSTIRLLKLTYFAYQSRYSADALILSDGTYNTESEAYQILIKLIDRFYLEAERLGSTPIVLLMPADFDLENARRGRKSIYSPLKNHLETNKREFIDLLEVFQMDGASKTVKELIDHHYTPIGNEIVAKAVATHVTKDRLDKG